MPVVNSVVILSAFLMRRLSMPLRLPVGTIFLSEKNSVSIRSKLFGAVTARLLTSSVVTATYWMALPGAAWKGGRGQHARHAREQPAARHTAGLGSDGGGIGMGVGMGVGHGRTPGV